MCFLIGDEAFGASMKVYAYEVWVRSRQVGPFPEQADEGRKMWTDVDFVIDGKTTGHGGRKKRVVAEDPDGRHDVPVPPHPRCFRSRPRSVIVVPRSHPLIASA